MNNIIDDDDDGYDNLPRTLHYIYGGGVKHNSVSNASIA